MYQSNIGSAATFLIGDDCVNLLYGVIGTGMGDD
jgi:hypothetical protein